jgi:hypothetical protein
MAGVGGIGVGAEKEKRLGDRSKVSRMRFPVLKRKDWGTASIREIPSSFGRRRVNPLCLRKESESRIDEGNDRFFLSISSTSMT